MTTQSNGITPQQIKLLHTLLGSTGLREQKADLISGLTEGRTESSKALTEPEAAALIDWLKKESPLAASMDKMRKLMISSAHRMDWKLLNGKIDMERLNAWCLSSKSGNPKPLMAYTHAELVKVASQFGKVYESYLKTIK